MLVRFDDAVDPVAVRPVGGIVAGLTGLLVIIVTVFMRYLLPDGHPGAPRVAEGRALFMLGLPRVRRRSRSPHASASPGSASEYFDGLHIRFIGGLDSNIVIFLLALVILLFAASATVEHGKPTHGPRLSVAFLIPAYNEGRDLAECIQAIDAAAAGHSERLHALRGRQQLVGRHRRGRAGGARRLHQRRGRGAHLPNAREGARAQPRASSRITEDVVIRIDADTIVSPVHARRP